MKEKTIFQLIADNHLLASALHFLGIHFNNYSEHTLADICKERGLNVEVVESRIKDALKNENKNEIRFEGLPIELLVEYLKHNHYIFIKQRLPFITDLIKNFDGDAPEIKKELKLVFPLFIEDFIEHMYEEEDTLFTYILLLNKALKDQSILNKVQAKMMENSIRQYQGEHEVHDDHLKGLRKLTNEFEIHSDFDLNTKVVITELKKLDGELRYHAKIENDILFPKAIALERQVLAMLRSKIALN